MTTKNIVPRADGEGELGTSSKKWSKVQAVTGSFDHIQTTTMASEIYTSGSTKFGDTSDDTHQFTGSVLVDGSVTASDDLFVGDDLIVAGEVNVAGRLRPNAHIDFDNSAGYIRDNQTQPRIGWPTNTSDTLLYNSSGTHAEITIGDTEVTFAGNITASGHVSASAFYGDGTGITGVTAEWDGSHDGDAEITGSLFVKAADGGGFNLVGDNGTTSGSILHSFGGVTIGNSTTAAIGLFNFGPEVFMSNTSASVSVDGAHITMSPGAGGAAKVNGDSEVSGTLAVSASSGVTSFNPNGINWITGSSVTLAAPAINLKNGDVTVGVDGESRQVTVNGHLSASLGITGSEVHATEIYGANYHEPGVLTPTYSISSLGMFIYNDVTVGINAEPDTFVVDRSEKKVGVNCDIADLPDANFSVSGSTALGNLVTDTHIISGSTEVYVEAQTGLQVLQNVASAGYPVARFENTNAGGSTYVETHGTNQGGIKMYRGGVVRASIDTGGNAFCMYNGTPIPANLGFMIQSGKAEFKETTADNFTGTKAQLNISASSGPAIRIDSGATPQETTFKVEDYTSTMVSASADLLTMDDTNAPPTPSSAAHMYAKSGEMFVMDTGGNETQISPHDEDGEWQYFSRNTRTGRVVRIRMEKMIRKLEELTGETFIEEE